MSRKGYTRHIPDIRLITHYAETMDSPVHRMNPWTKAAMLFFVVALVTVVMDLTALLTVYLLTVGFFAAAKLPLRLLVGWYLLPMMFVLTLVVMFVFTEPGEEVAGVDVGPLSLSVTDNGLILLAKLTLRALAVVTFSLTVFMTTRYTQVVYLARRTMPGILATMFLLTYRFLYVTSDEMMSLLDAVHSKNGSMARGVLRQSRMFAGIFAHSFIHAFDRAERVSKAMEARGFAGTFPVSEKVPAPSPIGFAAICILFATLVMAVMSRYLEFSVW